MAPEGKTSLVAEIACQPEDAIWTMDEAELTNLVTLELIKIGWIKKEDIIQTGVHLVPDAYPILEIGCEEKVRKILAYLKQFRNLQLSGRNGRFVYSWMHDMMKFGKEIVNNYFIEAGNNGFRPD